RSTGSPTNPPADRGKRPQAGLRRRRLRSPPGNQCRNAYARSMVKAPLIVDVQNDFTEGGALGGTGGDRVAEGPTGHLAAHAGGAPALIAPRDWHDADSDNGGHFSDTPDFVDSWPVHCVADSTGAEFDPLLSTAAITHEVRKGQGRPDYSAFQGTTETGSSLGELLEELTATELDVVG